MSNGGEKLDLSMPGLDGKRTFHRLRGNGHKTPVILSSGYDESNATKRFQKLDLAAFLQKPYSSDLLIKTVTEVAGVPAP